MSEEPPLVDLPVRRGRRTTTQRLLLLLSVTLTVLAVGAAALVGWGAWKLNSIDRADVALDELVAGGPSNYLIVGSDSRSGGDPVDPGATDDRMPLADTIMLVRIDPQTTTARVLSLPRDLWVTLPATGEKGRVNAAYANGPQELIDTLRSELGVPINHYVEIDFSGFQQVVSAIDGVPMYFDRAMQDDNSGLNIAHPGCITLDGPQALGFARARHLRYFTDGGFAYDGTGDLGRMSRQQVFLRRVIDRARSKVADNPLKIKDLVDVGTASTTIDAGLTVDDLVTLGRRFSSFDSADLASYALPVTPRTTAGGAQIVDLDPTEAQPVLTLFREETPADPSTPTTGPAPTTDSSAAPGAADPDDVSLTVLNSSGRDGLAASVADDLGADGFDVDDVGNGVVLGHGVEARSVVRFGAGAQPDAALVAQAAGGAATEPDPSLEAGSVVLYLGDDFTALAPGSTDGSSDDSTDGAPSAASPASEGSGASATGPEPSEPVGVVPGDPPAGTDCG